MTFASSGVGLEHVTASRIITATNMQSFSSNSSPERPQNDSQSTRTSPYQHRNRNLRRFLEDTGQLVPRVLAVLNFMRQQNIDLSSLLWAISWNVEELTGNTLVSWERTSLMLSDNLPAILHNWLRPPRHHSAGVRTKAAGQVMRSWAVDTVCDTINDEMRGLKELFKSPPSELSQEKLTEIDFADMISEVSKTAPTLWKVLRNAAYTPRQEKKNVLKNPDMVRHHVCGMLTIESTKNLGRSDDDLNGLVLALRT